MPELLKSLTEWFKEKTSSPLYLAFIFTFISWNWKVFYILFFESNINDVTRLEYAQNFSRLYYQYPFSYFGNWQDIFIPLVNTILIFIFIFLVPIIATYFIVWEIPILANHAHKINSKYKLERKKQSHKEGVDYQEFVASQKTREATAVTVQAKAEKEIKNTLTQEELWTKEYEELEKNKMFQKKFQQILDSIYKHTGWIGSTQERLVDVDILTLSHINNLIQYKEDSTTVIELTAEKGKFFANLYIQRRAADFF